MPATPVPSTITFLPLPPPDNTGGVAARASIPNPRALIPANIRAVPPTPPSFSRNVRRLKVPPAESADIDIFEFPFRTDALKPLDPGHRTLTN